MQEPSVINVFIGNLNTLNMLKTATTQNKLFSGRCFSAGHELVAHVPSIGIFYGHALVRLR
jgi:hypothetical protein